MPEGPEIKIAADEIAKAIKGRKTTAVHFAHKHLRKFEKKLSGKRVIDVQTRGKAILTMFDNDLVIYSHNQLYGRWITLKTGEIPDTARQLRLAIHTDGHSALLYSASEIEVLPANKLGSHPFLSRLGPDLLSQAPTVRELADRLDSKRFRNRQLSGLLLDQGFVAGLGNYLRAEILRFSGIHPLTRPAQCSRAELRKLATQILGLTLRSYKTRGVINPPSLIKRLKSEGRLCKEEYRFSIYDRESEQCYFCDQKIKRINAGGRHIYYCPGCQPAKN